MNDAPAAQPFHPPALDRSVQGVLGEAVDRVDGPAKVTGGARYAYEFDLPGTAYGYVIGATIGHGRVTRIDAEAARAAPGVIAVLVDDPRLPSDTSNGKDDEMRAFSRDVRFFGQSLGIVVADSFEAARAAAALVEVDYAVEAGRFAADFDHDVEAKPAAAFVRDVDIGDIDAALAGSAAVIDSTFETPMHLPAAMEPHATTASWDGDRLTIRSSLQMVAGSQKTVAATLGIDPDKVRVIATYVGGGFGGKTGVGVEVVLAAIAAQEVGRPVKVALARRQTGQLVHHRSPTRQRLRVGADAGGRITAIAQEGIAAQNDWRGFIEPIPFGSIPLYAGPARRFTTSVVRVDLPASGAVRAPGEAIGSWPIESAIDELAVELGIDPVALRILNEPAADPTTGKPFSTRRLVDCYREGARRFGWDGSDRTPGTRREGEWLIGTGMAAAFRGNFSVRASAKVRLTPEGRAEIETDLPDIGTGTYTIVAQVAAELLGLPIEAVDVRLGDSTYPVTAGAGGSFGAGSAASAVALACEELIDTLAQRMDSTPSDMTLKDGHAIAGNRRVPIGDLARDGLEALGKTAPGSFVSGYSQASHGAQFAEVAVNAVTGEVRVRRMLGVFDCGRVLNRKTARSQLLGGMIWGIGSALHEDAVVDGSTGQFVNPDFGEYHIAVHADAPRIEVHFIEEADDVANPIGAKAVGELGISGAGAAVTNAIWHATGYRARHWPVTVDRLLTALPPL